MWGHVGRPGGDAGERVGVGKCFSQAPRGGTCYHGSCSAAHTVRTCILVSIPVNLNVLTYLFLQQMLATYCLHGSSWLVGEMYTKLIHQEMYHYGYNFVDAVKKEGKRRFLFGLGLQGRLL